jgi:tetratricopeptide (TPR) repeat protein
LSAVRLFSPFCLAVCLGALTAVLVSAPVRADDSLIEAKRQTIAVLMREYKFRDAAEMSDELLNGDPTHYQDHLILARAYEKIAQPKSALAEYQAVRDLLPAVPKNEDERSAIAEAERRVKVLDPTAAKVEQAISDLDKKLENLERSCLDSHDKSGLDRIKQIRDQLAFLYPKRTHVLLDVSAKTNWAETGIVVVTGQRYQVVATGSWSDFPYPQLPSDADGLPNQMINGYRQGALLGRIAGGAIFLLGKNTSFVASSTGLLQLAINGSGRNLNDHWGSQHVYVGLLPAAADAN